MAEHGTRRRYQTGCHCRPCREAEAAYSRARRAHDPAVRYETPRRAALAELLIATLTDVDTGQPWARRALCATVAEDLWFIDRGESSAPAREVCAACPVQPECLDYAVTNRIRHGIWGGLTEKQRRRVAPSSRAA